MSRHPKFDQCSDPSSDTCSEIRSICSDCDKPACNKVTKFCEVKYCPPPTKYDPGVSYFTSVVTPLSNLAPSYSGCTGSVEFRMRRKNKVVTLQWEPFSGTMAASGVAFLTVAQSICNTPPYPISLPMYLEYMGVGRPTHVDIDPSSRSGNIRFYLNTDGSASNVNVGDSVFVPGGCVTWIVE